MSPLHIFKYDANVRYIEKVNCIPFEPLERYNMSTTDNNISEKNVDDLLLDSRDKRTKNTLIEAIDSLGVKKSRNNNKNNESNIQELEDDADEIKQTFIHDYKNCYNES